MKETIVSRKIYVSVFVALLCLTGATYGLASIDLGPGNIIVALAIAISKAFLVALFFMHLRYSPRLMWVVVGGGLFWLGIMLTLTLDDYLTRGWMVGGQ
jgi:cytochrome c oxidase subunit 4